VRYILGMHKRDIYVFDKHTSRTIVTYRS